MDATASCLLAEGRAPGTMITFLQSAVSTKLYSFDSLVAAAKKMRS